MVRHGCLRKPDGLLDVAGAQPPFVQCDQPARGLTPRLQELEDFQARRIAEGLEDRDEVSTPRFIDRKYGYFDGLSNLSRRP